MATIHRTTLVPTKLELLGGWLPEQSWYRATGQPPALTRAGGFRLDDPAGEVGIEFAFVADGTDDQGTTYHVPMSYRGAPLPEAEPGLIGTSEHGVLGRRWIYDAAYDPVAVATLLDFLSGGIEAQHQSQSDVPDLSVARHWPSAARLTAPSPLRVANDDAGRTTVAVDLSDGSSAPAGERLLDIVRVLQAGSVGTPEGSLGSVEADWTRPDGGTARGSVVVVR
jgi:hypothetical protein